MQRVVTAWAFLGQKGSAKRRHHASWNLRSQIGSCEWSRSLREKAAAKALFSCAVSFSQLFMIDRFNSHCYRTSSWFNWQVLRPAFHRHPWTCSWEPLLNFCKCVVWQRCVVWLPLYRCVLRNIIRAAIPGAPKRQKAWRLAIQIWINIDDGDVIGWSQVSGGFCNGKSCSTGFVGGQVASKPSAVIMSLVFLIGKSFPRPQAHSIGKVYAGLGLPCSLWHIGGTTDDLKPLKCNFSIISFMLQGYKDYVWLCFLPTKTQKTSCNESSFAKSSHYCRENAWKCHWTSTERQQQHATASMTGWDADDSMDIDLDVCFSMTDKIEKAMTYDLKIFEVL